MLPSLGELIGEEKRRDAVHVAIAPATAAEVLQPGQNVGFVEQGNVDLVGAVDQCIGIVDPFLTDPVPRNERCWVLLYPNSIAGLRHVWTHPAFTANSRKPQESS